MKKVINISLYVIMFLLVAFICVLSIKKYFDKKQIKKLDNILAVNYIQDFVSFNKIELFIDEKLESIEFKEKPIVNNIKEESVKEEQHEKKEKITEDIEIQEEIKDSNIILFDNLREEDLVINIEKHLKNELSGTGKMFVEFYKLHGLDPYLAASIVLHETGCTWKCSSLVRECFNYGGMKGGEKKYKDTNYSCYSSKDEGINAYLNMLYNNYYAKGLTTPELINPKYASSLEWSVAINRYIDKFKNS